MCAVEAPVHGLRHFPKTSVVQLFGTGALGNLLGNGTLVLNGTSRHAAMIFVEEHQGAPSSMIS